MTAPEAKAWPTEPGALTRRSAEIAAGLDGLLPAILDKAFKAEL